MNTNSNLSLEKLSFTLKLIPISEILLSDEFYSGTWKTVAQWCVDYLCNPHPELGRSGVVCPHSQVSMKKETFWITEIKTKGRTEKEIKEDIVSLAHLFYEQEPRNGNEVQFKTIVSVWDDLYPEEYISNLHSEMKPIFLRMGLMLGEFFSSCEKTGLRNPIFYPLCSPVPLLVVRDMLEFDIAFLSDSEEYVSEYINKYGERGVLAINNVLNNNKKIHLSDKQVSILKSYLMHK
ncbi:DUF6875 domain-containing protein [Xenorhabdus nematophila]|uniref:DUF6875 domain-containing protein n=1 Tax=Xenorhabdus nematophila (strain ATCC 19061 / DSM 3370 / CCUG 14189 / LMG 1036 / NCIMB 9965 / AN6) TaxID=406817 RepID=D3VI28_XENNA|nr:hypothetical protein [Xenorhabdus nematophila]CBJ88517.1 hypothetical protein XNC1_0443 [Xenorhabdus nematophila ATCC 19061]CCW29581.1 conserved hypothetical protein [Xenorhabdus nematophila F1]CEE94864.1 hypothetical protein XNA1_4810084 [Xenorhabdus nematophila str. Anatoliense]CEK21433.1 hypothetical protein XNC2_0434 [Xenorhabdus nematophila AN6/1]